MARVDRQNQRRALVGLGRLSSMAALGALLVAASAHAQLAVSDAATEGNTAAIQANATAMVQQLLQANQTLGQDLQENTQSAQSLTTPGGAGIWTGQAQYLSSLMQTLASGVADPQTFATTYPGWFDPGADAIYTAESLVTHTLNTYSAALGVVQSQAADFGPEDSHLGTIESCNAGASSVLMAMQCNTEAQLAVAQQTQLQRQLLMTLITTMAVASGEQLNEKSQVQAANAVNFNLGVMP
jgi:hypothetical protein